MPYNKQTWADSPATTSPLSAARLNHIEDGIAGAYPTETTRIMSHSNGGLGIFNTTVNTATASFRICVKLPVTTTRWRLKLRNFDTYAQATKPALTGKKIIHGDHAQSGAETGSFVGNTATTIVGSDFAIPGNGGWYTSPWVTAPADQFDADTEHLIGIAWQAGSAITQQMGIGRSWYWSNITSGVDPAVAGSAANIPVAWIPIDWAIEYESTSTRSAWLCFGDSIMEGTTAGRGAGLGPTSLHRAYPNQWAVGANALVQNHSLFAIQATMITNPSHNYWTRLDTSQSQWTGALIALGANDIMNNRTLAQIQADLLTMIANARGIVGPGKPIYLVNIAPLGVSDGREPIRTGLNSWIADLPGGIAGVVDADRAMRTNSTNTGDAALMTSDNIHPSWQGLGVLAAAVRSTLPS